MKKHDNNKKKRWVWVAALVALVAIGILLAGGANGWFDGNKIELDVEYYTNRGFMGLTATEYDSLVDNKKSFVVFVDQFGCTTADRLREFMKQYMEKNEIAVYRIMFEEMKETRLHDFVKYYPSVAIIDEGEVKMYLRADSNDNAIIYNSYEDFGRWMDEYIDKKP